MQWAQDVDPMLVQHRRRWSNIPVSWRNIYGDINEREEISVVWQTWVLYINQDPSLRSVTANDQQCNDRQRSKVRVPLDTRRCCDVESTSPTLIRRRNNVVYSCLLGEDPQGRRASMGQSRPRSVTFKVRNPPSKWLRLGGPVNGKSSWSLVSLSRLSSTIIDTLLSSDVEELATEIAVLYQCLLHEKELHIGLYCGVLCFQNVYRLDKNCVKLLGVCCAFAS